MIRALALLAFFAAALQARAEAPKIEVRGTHDDDAFRKEARGALRHAWPAFCELGGVKPEKDDPYVVNVYRQREEYLKADRDLNGGRFANNGGFFSVETGESHLLMSPRVEADFTKRVPLTERMRTLIVHETSHMFWRRHVVWYAGAPQWALEGMAEYCAERELGAGALDGIYFSTGLQTLRRAIDSGRILPLEDISAMDLSAQPDAFLRDLYYRESWLLVKWLVEEKPDVWSKLVEDFATVPDRDTAAARGRTFFAKRVGAPRDVQKAWTDWIRGLKSGPWEMKYGDWRIDAGELEGTAYPKTGSAILNEAEIKGDATIDAEVWIQDLANGQADIVIGAWDDRARNLVKVAFMKGGVTALLVLKEDKWERIAFTQSTPPAIPAATWKSVHVEIAGRKVRACVEGKEVLDFELADEDVRLDGRWGFGNFDSSVRFRKWKVETK
ncbi:MAG: hypothetical protein K8T20_07350 [Planctomycetes bacterium]|nr:hypothetical protein [Planctomycetota bacterium]